MTKREEILLILNKGINHVNDIKHFMSISKKNLIDELDILVMENLVYNKKGSLFYGIIKKGVVEIKPSGYGFIIVDGEEKDYFVRASELNGIYNGDEVLFYPVDENSRLLAARIIKVSNRANKYIIGTYIKKVRKGKEKAFILSSNPKFDVKAIVKKGPTDLEDGIIVYAQLNYVGTAIEATILEVLGHKDDPGIEISQIALEYGFTTDFNEDVIKEIAEISDYVLDEQKIGRKDFTNRLIFTIDGDDSKDFDDAVDIVKNDDGSYRLGVYIADVSEYVKENAPLDLEALNRGTSVYLADRVIPMIPHKLSNGICSLNENVERLSLACIMQISKDGNLLDYEICECVIKSKHRMTYSNVNKIINGDLELREEYSDIVESIETMVELSDIIRNLRFKKGGLDFDVSEYKFSLNQDGSPKEIIPRVRDKAEMLIEDFMLMANQTIAYNMKIMNLPCMYRVHEKPDQDKLRDVFGIIENMGVSVDLPKKSIKPKQIQEALEQIDESPFKPILNNLLLRSMMKAKYSEECLGHYGLAMYYYCHFTSPIRRYPDLITHRIIKRVLLHPENLENDINHFNTILPEIASANSKSERLAIECERSVDDMLYAWYMENNLECVFDGIITSMPSFGIFVTLENGVEGLVALDNMLGYFEYNSSNMSFSNGKKTYKLGDKVKVVCIGADKKRRRVDFMFLSDYEEYEG